MREVLEDAISGFLVCGAELLSSPCWRSLALRRTDGSSAMGSGSFGGRPAFPFGLLDALLVSPSLLTSFSTSSLGSS